MSSNPSASPQARRKDAGAALSTERPGPTASRSGRKPKEAYEAILRLPLAELTWIYSLSAWIYPTAKELSVERLYRSRSLKNSRSGTLKNSRSGIFRKIEVPTRKPTYSGDRRTVTPSVLHEDTRPTHGPTHVQNSVEGYQEDTENYQVDREIITRAWLGYAASGTRPTPSSHNATETVTLLKENSFSHPPNSQRGRT